MVKRQAESDAKIEYLVQAGKKTEQRLNDLAGQQQSQEEQARVVAQQLKQYQETIRDLRASQDEIKARLTLLAQQTSTPRIEVVNPESASKTTRDIGPPADYVKAFGLYSANNFAAAIESFESFFKLNPQSDYAANALYWIGECHYTLSDLPKARDAFFKVADNYPKSPKAPDSLLKLGYTLTAMKEKEKALAIYDSLIKSYPSSPAAVKARERMGAN
jgi:tol-pal system protein YbgF